MGAGAGSRAAGRTAVETFVRLAAAAPGPAALRAAVAAVQQAVRAAGRGLPELTARYRLTRYAGHPEAPEPDLLNVGLRPGDVLLLRTDGISDQVSYERLTRVLETATSPAAAVEALLDDSLRVGDDNATAVVVRVG